LPRPAAGPRERTVPAELATPSARRTEMRVYDAILKALREQLQREAARARPTGLAAEILEIGNRCAALPDLDQRTPEEIIGFDEFGIPR
jgi:antitoxin VapB